MPRVKLSKTAIDALPIGAKDCVYWDANHPGWASRSPRKAGRFSSSSIGWLARVRACANSPSAPTVASRSPWRGDRLRRYSRRVWKAATRPAEKRDSRWKLVVDQVNELIETFIQDRVARLRSARAVSNRLRREVGARWANKASTRSRNAMWSTSYRRYPPIVVQVSPIEPSKLCGRSSVVCRTRASRLLPAEGVQSFWTDKIRDRVLTDKELAAVIKAAPLIDPPYGGILEMLALTGQRREEVAQMTWDEIDAASNTWTGEPKQEQEVPYRAPVKTGATGARQGRSISPLGVCDHQRQTPTMLQPS